ncbi:neuroglobin-like [Babylonia areolata]|uniref:neuroglobin-like n=1 Tax=Babylonia areolata TaxID=304850 RepID=UPI003FD4B3D8
MAFGCDEAYSQILRGLPEERPQLTARQKEIVMESWEVIQRDISRVGVVMFMGLFETHPDVQDAFQPFQGRSLEELRHSRQLKGHVLKVMNTVEKCLARIHEPDKLESLLHDLGAKHLLYNARIDYIDLIGPQFIYAVQPAMGDLWTPEIESAWADLFRLISHIMKEAMVF